MLHVLIFFVILFHHFCTALAVFTRSTALAVFTRSPAAFEALKNFGILQLPSHSMLQSYTGVFLHEPGASSDCIANQLVN